MKEIKASIWDKQFDGHWRVIPVNTVVKADGHLVMGAGLAKQAAERYSDLAKLFGRFYYVLSDLCLIKEYGLIGFPTKFNWRDGSSVGLIDQGLLQLKVKYSGLDGKKIVSPRLGCGLGGLNWDDVKPLVEKYFGDDDNFVVVSL